ncbi:MAG: hypothetical protein PHG65_02510 [Kiritimatiellae bacterium]|nr:hypothetical protein [Kiritimatiellia bacterium]
MRRPHTILSILAACALSAGAQEQLSPGQPEESGIISGNQFFYVVGADRAEMLEIALWSEDVAERIAAFMGVPYPQRAGETLLRIELIYGEELPVRVEERQYDSDAGFRQVLILQNVTKNEQTEALRALCRLILGRYARGGLRAAPSVSDPSVPGWMVDGMMMQWLPMQRIAGREALLQAWEAGETFTIDRILSEEWSEPLQSGVAGEWFKWLLNQPGSAALFQAALARVGSGREITGEWLIGQCSGFGTLREWNQAWSLHLAMLPSTILLPGALLPEDVVRLRESLVINPEMISVVIQEDVPYTYMLQDMIEGRHASWMPALAAALAARIQEVSLGRAPELQESARAYLDYLEAVPLQSDGWWSTDASDEELHALLEKADHLLQTLEEKLQTRQLDADSVTDE